MAVNLKTYFNQDTSFRSQIIRLASGNVIAAVLPFVFQPVIARLYTPADYSIYGWYMTFLSIISVFATGKYELALIIPESDKHAKNLAVLSLILSISVSVVAFILSLVFYSYVPSYFKTERVFWFILIGPGVLFFCAYQVFSYLANRYSLYNQMSVSKINQNGVMIAFQLILGLLSIGELGLIFGRVFGYLISALFLGWFVYRYSPVSHNEIDRFQIRSLARKYKNFPGHLIFSNLLAVLYTQIPFMYIARQYDPGTAGQFAFSMQMITVPGALISNAIGDVFRQKASELYRFHGRFDKLVISTVRNSLIFSLLPFLILILFSAPIFEFVFGESWILAGKFSSALSIMAFISFFISPVDKAAIVINKTSYEFWYHIIRFIANIVIILIAGIFSLSVFEYLYLLVLITAVQYFVDLFFMYRFSLPARSNG